MNKFITFIESLRNSSNDELINIIKEGYHIIYESLSTDDANGKPNGNTVSDPSVASVVDYQQNDNNEYFPQTLTDTKLDKVSKSYIGSRVAAYPQAARTSVGKDPINKFQSTPNVNGVGGEYAGGGSGGLK
jgi:hypothetical protein